MAMGWKPRLAAVAAATAVMLTTACDPPPYQHYKALDKKAGIRPVDFTTDLAQARADVMCRISDHQIQARAQIVAMLRMDAEKGDNDAMTDLVNLMDAYCTHDVDANAKAFRDLLASIGQGG